MAGDGTSDEAFPCTAGLRAGNGWGGVWHGHSDCASRKRVGVKAMFIGWRVLPQPKIPDTYDSGGHQQAHQRQPQQAQPAMARLLMRGGSA